MNSLRVQRILVTVILFNSGLALAQGTPSMDRKRPSKAKESIRTKRMLNDIKESRGEIVLESLLPYDSTKFQYFYAYFDQDYKVTKNEFSEGLFKAYETYLGGGPVIKFMKVKPDSVVIHDVKKGDSLLGSRSHDFIVSADVYYTKMNGRHHYVIRDGFIHTVRKTNRKGTRTKYFLEMCTDGKYGRNWPRLTSYRKDGTIESHFRYFSVSKNLNLINWKEPE